tara:strand:- start:2701 stop:3123 length:423 start_codon:yes stop_codon:yes gene_type:complete
MKLPHTYPILLVDTYKIIDNTKITATFTVPEDHPVLEGHFPHVKIWPGVYLIEGMNQTAGIHALDMAEKQFETSDLENMVTFVTSVDKVKFRQPVFPGDVLTYSAVLEKQKRDHVFYECGVSNHLQAVAQASIGLTAKKL